MSKQKTIQRVGDPFFGLTVRAANCLGNARLNTREQVLAAVKRKRLHPDNLGAKGSARPLCRNYGWKTHAEVCKWLGLPEPSRRKMDRQRLDRFELRGEMQEIMSMDQLPVATACWDIIVRMDLNELPPNIRAVKVNGKWFVPADGFGGETVHQEALERKWRKMAG